MGDITIPADVWQHPLVWWAILLGVAVTIVVKFGSANAVTLSPFFKWWSEREARAILRRAEIEAAALILNDQRIVALTDQVRGLATELAAARAEIASLRAELAAYRGDHPEL
ncbi:hypothetical protein ICV35_23995 [Rhodococcus ruber]|uniref:hypothetical protein n=1 Tax=Rhodococcus ruber TaxID=1830 RepID=UPI001781A492|nr:hypothetical protein [Rhodococcus ruber]MBD8056714.1 hypothetical protein [Rhodococcus ruber]